MPRIAVTPQKASTSGTALTFSAPDPAGIFYPRALGRLFHVKNGSGAGITVTLQTPGSIDGNLAIPDRTISVAAGAHTIIGIPEGNTWYDQADGNVYADFSATASITVAITDPA